MGERSGAPSGFSPASIVISKPPVAVQLPQPDVSANRDAPQARFRHPHRSSEITDARLQTEIRAFDVLQPPNPQYRELVSAIRVPSLLVTDANVRIGIVTALWACGVLGGRVARITSAISP